MREYSLYIKILSSALFAALVAALLCGCAPKGNSADSSSDENSQSSSFSSERIKHELYSDGYATFLKLIENLDNKERYLWKTSGYTRANKGIIKYVQEIQSEVQKNGDEWNTKNKSTSAFVKLDHNVYLSGGVAEYEDSRESEKKKPSYDEYRKKFGVLPCDKGFAGYIIDETTVMSAENDFSGEEDYSLKVNLNADKAAKNMVIQMKNFGGLNDYPKYDSLQLNIVYDKDFTVLYFSVCAVYDIDIAVLGKMKCTMKINTECSYN